MKFKKLKPREYNSKAREAFAHSLIDIGVAIFKSVMLLFTAVPIASIFKAAITNESTEVPIWAAITNMSDGSYIALMVFLGVAFIAGHWLRREGLRHLHEMENAA